MLYRKIHCAWLAVRTGYPLASSVSERFDGLEALSSWKGSVVRKIFGPMFRKFPH